MRINVKDAVVKTAQVEVRVLAISGKQVTLAVFRQLQESRLLDDRFDLRGPVWGTVNYHPDGCGKDPEHLHVVWQDGSELRRCRVDPPKRLRDFFLTADDSFLRALLSEGRRPGGVSRERARYGYGEPTGKWVKDEWHYEVAPFPNAAGRDVFVVASEEVRRFVIGDVCFGWNSRCGVEGDHKAHWLFRPPPWEPGDAETEWQHLVQEDQAEQALHEKSVDQWNALVDLPQLFIAV